MRSTLIIGTFALCTFATPIPKAYPKYRGGEESCTHRGGMLVCPSKREIDVQNYAIVNSNSENIEARAIRNQGRSPTLGRNKNSRDVQEEGVKIHSVRKQRLSHAPILSRPKNARDEEGQEVEVRAIRNQGRFLDPHRKEEDEADIQARENQAQEAVRGQRRSAEPINRSTKSSRALGLPSDGELELDAVREPGKDRPVHPRSSEEGYDRKNTGAFEAASGLDKRIAKAEPIFRAGSGK